MRTKAIALLITFFLGTTIAVSTPATATQSHKNTTTACMQATKAYKASAKKLTQAMHTGNLHKAVKADNAMKKAKTRMNTACRRPANGITPGPISAPTLTPAPTPAPVSVTSVPSAHVASTCPVIVTGAYVEAWPNESNGITVWTVNINLTTTAGRTIIAHVEADILDGNGNSLGWNPNTGETGPLTFIDMNATVGAVNGGGIYKMVIPFFLNPDVTQVKFLDVRVTCV